MAATQNSRNDMTEECPECTQETAHSVSLQIRTESTKSENAQFSREPYRVTTCLVCGHERALRMNNA
ncbi:hypothetical protein [Halomarina rubra]|uniref:DUF7835 domain-containing protein n=1 Tax=Halomarina rubra TaxID=2071873 RepID=A0ABD6AYY0_9EURY|nr:hypothetical protein [Halomarina rubra]